MSELITTTAFDYGSVPVACRDDVKSRAREINRLADDSENNFKMIGEKLLDAKDRLPHGQFEAWRAAELPKISKGFAWVLMNTAKLECSVTELLSLPYDVRSAAVSPNVPDAAREEILEISRHGEAIKLPQAKEIINRHKGIAPVTPEEKKARAETAKAERELLRQQRGLESQQRNIAKQQQRMEREAEQIRAQQLAALENTDALPREVELPEVQFVAATQSPSERADECVAACQGVTFKAFPGGLLREAIEIIRALHPHHEWLGKVD